MMKTRSEVPVDVTPRRRLIRTIRRQPADRVPVTTYELNPWAEGWRTRSHWETLSCTALR